MISASLADYARDLDALGLTQTMVLGDWSYKVGTGGLDVGDPLLVLPVNPAASDLIAPVGGTRPLGRVRLSGTGAVATATTNGEVVITGMAGLSGSSQRRWVSVATGPMAGTWLVTKIVSPTSCAVFNPLFTGSATIAWELREKVLMQVSDTAAAYHAHLAAGDLNGNTFGEVAIFGRVLFAPSQQPLVGLSFVLAIAHHPAKVKHSGKVLNHYVAVQR